MIRFSCCRNSQVDNLDNVCSHGFKISSVLPETKAIVFSSMSLRRKMLKEYFVNRVFTDVYFSHVHQKYIYTSICISKDSWRKPSRLLNDNLTNSCSCSTKTTFWVGRLLFRAQQTPHMLTIFSWSRSVWPASTPLCLPKCTSKPKYSIRTFILWQAKFASTLSKLNGVPLGPYNLSAEPCCTSCKILMQIHL